MLLKVQDVRQLDVLEFDGEHKLTNSLPNTFIALRIVLTIPVLVVSGE